MRYRSHKTGVCYLVRTVCIIKGFNEPHLGHIQVFRLGLKCNVLHTVVSHTSDMSAQLSHRQGWIHQCKRLLLCLMALLGSPVDDPPRADPLLQAAAARTLAVLCDDLQWKCFPVGEYYHY